MTTQNFKVPIQNAGGGGAFVKIPFNVEKEFGSKRPKVKTLIESVPHRGALVRMGTVCHKLYSKRNDERVTRECKSP